MKTIVLALLVATSAHAANSNDPIFIPGVGATRCDALNASLAKGETKLPEDVASWLQGFVGALNLVRHEKGRGNLQRTTAAQASDFIAGYCRANPMKYVWNGAMDMTNGMGS